MPIDELAALAANDNVPVFDRAHELPALTDDAESLAWSPSRQPARRGVVVRYAGDGPTVEHRIAAGQAWYSSGRYSGQHANDNKDWPLAKLLRTEGHERHLRLAERYRQLWEAANNPVDLVGRDMGDNIYLMVDIQEDESTGARKNKGVKKVKGKKARLDMPATRALRTRPDQPKARAAPVAKKWQGDWPLLNRIDANRELAAAQSALGWLREPFEGAVCGGETLETIGRSHGIGNPKGAVGAGRALVFLGFDAIEQHWQRQRAA